MKKVHNNWSWGFGGQNDGFEKTFGFGILKKIFIGSVEGTKGRKTDKEDKPSTGRRIEEIRKLKTTRSKINDEKGEIKNSQKA